jgi:ribonuclease BN (tRNA processing enzyme)
MLLGDDILIDAGTGVGSLSMAELCKIDHVFVTHAHLDHVAFIPFLVDTAGFFRTRAITVYAIQATPRWLYCGSTYSTGIFARISQKFRMRIWHVCVTRSCSSIIPSISMDARLHHYLPIIPFRPLVISWIRVRPVLYLPEIRQRMMRYGPLSTGSGI